MDTLQAQRLLGGPTSPNTPSGQPATSSLDAAGLAPMTASAAAQQFQTQEQQFADRNTQPGVELDTQTGLAGWDRLKLSFRREQENQVVFLQGKYGKENVRLADDGSLIVRALDSDTQKPKDILVDERNISFKDLIDLGGAAPELAASIVAMRAGRASPTIGTGAVKGIRGMLRDVFTSAAGAEGAGAVKDVAANVVDRGEFNLGDVAKDRAQMFAGDVVIGGTMLPVAKLFSFMESPLNSSRGPIQFNAMAARDALEAKTGVKIPLTVGESTGSPLFSRTEVFMEKQPGGSMPFVEFRQKQEAALRKLQEIIMGKAPVSEEELGEKLLTNLRGAIDPLQDTADMMRKGVVTEAEATIASAITKQTSPVRQLYPEAVGNELRKGVTALRDKAKAEADSLYEKVRSLPGGEGAVFEGDGLQASLKKILDKLPSPETITEVPTGLVDEFGSAMTRTETGKEVLREFVPPNVLARLKAVVGLGEPKFSLSDLQQMRREVYDDIARGEGVPGLGTHYLADIGKALTAAIDDGVAAMPTGELKTALVAANKHYREKVVPFNRLGLTEMFRAADEPGNLTGTEIFAKLFTGNRATYNYELLKQTLGEKSPAFIGAKRAIADRLLEASKVAGEDAVDAAALIKNLTNFRKEYRAISDDIFGNEYGSLIRQGRFIAAAEGAKLSESEVSKLMANRTLTASKFDELIRAQRVLDEASKNSILRAVASGNLKEIKPTDLVGLLLSKEASPAEIKQIALVISKNPELQADVRAKTVENIFRGASRNATAADVDRLLTGEPTRIVSGTGIFKELEKPGVKENVLAILGSETFENLENYLRVEVAREVKQDSFKSAGGIAAGAQIATLTKRGPLRYLTQSVKNWVVARTLTDGSLGNWLSKVPANDPAAVSLVMGSVPFVQAVAREFGEGEAGQAVMGAIKKSIDRWTNEKTAGYNAQQNMNRRAEFERFLNQSTNSLAPAKR